MMTQRTRRATGAAAAAAIAFALVGVAASGAARAPRPGLAGHTLLVNQKRLRVYGPANNARTSCPHLLSLSAHAISTVKRAVGLAMPPFEKELHLNGHDAVVAVGLASGSGFSYLAAGCGPSISARTDWARSIFAAVRLPHVAGASLSQHRFAVGRVRQGWVIWGYIH